MNYSDGGLSASDVALLSGNTGRSNDGFGEMDLETEALEEVQEVEQQIIMF